MANNDKSDKMGSGGGPQGGHQNALGLLSAAAAAAVPAPSPEYWHKQNPVVDQIFITDVTANLVTVTVRECKTMNGFFRDRDCTTNGTDKELGANFNKTELK